MATTKLGPRATSGCVVKLGIREAAAVVTWVVVCLLSAGCIQTSPYWQINECVGKFLFAAESCDGKGIEEVTCNRPDRWDVALLSEVAAAMASARRSVTRYGDEAVVNLFVDRSDVGIEGASGDVLGEEADGAGIVDEAEAVAEGGAEAEGEVVTEDGVIAGDGVVCGDGLVAENWVAVGDNVVSGGALESAEELTLGEVQSIRSWAIWLRRLDGKWCVDLTQTLASVSWS